MVCKVMMVSRLWRERNNFGTHLMHTIQPFFKLPADPAMADTPNIAYTIFIFISSQLNNNKSQSSPPRN